MSQIEKIFQTILLGRADANIRFEDLTKLLARLGFQHRVSGSHHIFFQEGVEEIINLQPKASKAKAYQVKQVRGMIHKYRMEVPS